MIHARTALLAHVRAFVETELCGMVHFDELTHHLPEDAAIIPGKRKNPYGKHKEIVGVRFGEFDLTVASSFEVPPLGEIKLQHHGRVETGPLDPTTWTRMGAFVREKTNREFA